MNKITTLSGIVVGVLHMLHMVNCVDQQLLNTAPYLQLVVHSFLLWAPDKMPGFSGFTRIVTRPVFTVFARNLFKKGAY